MLPRRASIRGLLAAAFLAAVALPAAVVARPAAAKELLAEGLRLQKKGQYDDAIRAFEGAVRLEAPAELAAEIRVELAKTYFMKGKEASEGKLEGVAFRPALLAAARGFREVIARYPEVKEQASYAAYMTGSCYLLLGDMKTALASYKSAYMDYPDSKMRSRALVRLGVTLGSAGESHKAIQIFNYYKKNYPDEKNIDKVNKYIGQLSLVGRPAPPIHATRWVHQAVPGGLADLRGEVVVLVFLASWCTQCSKELPHLRREIITWSDKGVLFIGVANPDDPKSTEPIEHYIQKNQVDFFDLALDRGGRSWRGYRVTGLPAAAIIDRKGILRWRGHLSFMGHTLIEKLLAEGG